MSEIDLVKKCLEGDVSAQEELYSTLSGRVMNICERYLVESDLIQDAFQLTFIKFFNKLSQFDAFKGSLKSWSTKIAINTSLELLRKEKKNMFHEDISEIGGEDLYLSSHYTLEYADLKKMVDDLPEGQRLIFNLYAIEGYKHHEISEMLNISVGTSKSRLSRARVELKQMYKAKYEKI